MKPKKNDADKLAKDLQKHGKIRKALLQKREEHIKIDGLRMRQRDDTARRNYELELNRIKGELGSLRPGVAMDIVRSLKDREAQLQRLLAKR